MSQLPGYPQSIGSKAESVITKTGPASYDTVVTGSPPTGGQDVEAREFGLKYIEHLEGALSDDGQYEVHATPKISDAHGVLTWILIWITAATGAEVVARTDLSGRNVRLRAVGL